MRDGGFISEFDQHVASLIANVVCGGDVDAGTLVDEAYLMKLERKAFCHLIGHPKTHERILGMLNTRSEEHTSELQSQSNLVCRLLLEKKKNRNKLVN